MKIINIIILISLFAVNTSANEVDPIQVKYNECMQVMESQPPAQAVLCFQSVLKMDRKSLNTMYYLGMLYGQTEEYDKAVQSFENLLELEPSDKWAVNFYIPSLDVAGMREKSLKVAEKAAVDFPEHAGFHAYLIYRYQASDELDKAYKARENLLALVKNGKFDGLSSEKLYVREKFNIGEIIVYGIEYFRSGEDVPQIFSFITKFPDERERTYRVTYNKFMEEVVRKEQGRDALPYFFDAFDENRQSLVTAFIHEPTYEELKEVVSRDLTEGRKSFRVCVESPTSTTPVPCE